MKLPQYIEKGGLEIDGVIWFRKSFEVSKNDLGKVSKISLDPTDYSDEVYINGHHPYPHRIKRVYYIPSGVLIEGGNIVAVRVEDNGNGGGIYGKSRS